MIFLTSGPSAIETQSLWLPILQRAVDDADGRWSTEQLLRDVEDGRVMVWIVQMRERVVGVFTTRVIHSRITWVLVEDLAGEHIHEWLLSAHTALEAWAREMGAQQIMIEGRWGWSRMLRDFGYETRRVQAVKTLEVLQ